MRFMIAMASTIEMLSGRTRSAGKYMTLPDIGAVQFEREALGPAADHAGPGRPGSGAARVGTTRSRINYFMNKFRKLGLIEYNGVLKVHSALMNVIIRD